MTHTKALETLTTPEERAEYYSAVKQSVTLQEELPQKNYKATSSGIKFIGYLRMFTIRAPWFDKLGRNRQDSTFSEQGLSELGIVLNEANMVAREAL